VNEVAGRLVEEPESDLAEVDRKEEVNVMGTVSKKNKKNETVNLTTAQLRHLARPREGFEAQLEILIALYRANPQALYIDSSPDELEAELNAYRDMVAAEDAEREQLATMEDARLVRGSSLWSALLDLYARGQLASRTKPTIKRGIASAEQFMRTHRKRASAPVTPPVTTPVAPPPAAPVSTPGST
jgi:hypothetical protein